MKLIDIIDEWVPGDWGEENPSDETPVAVHCVRSADIVSIYQNTFVSAVVRFISARSLEKCQLAEGDIVVEKSGGTTNCSTGRVIYVDKEMLANNTPLVCSNFCTAFRLKKGWNSKYIYYYLRLVHKSGVFYNFEGKTSGIHNLLIDSAYGAIDMPNISYEEQCHKADVLTNIDAKIALNQRMNQKLEQTARRLYDYWFLQFDFPSPAGCVNANGQPIPEGAPYRTSGGAMSHNATLKRDIPVCWKNGELHDIANITMGQSPDGSSYNEEGNGTIFYQGCSDFGMRFPSVRMFTIAPSRFAKKGDVLMSVRAPVGTLNIANTDCCIGRGLAALNSKIGSVTHLYQVLADLKAAFDARNSVGTTFGSITKDDLFALTVVVPKEDVIKEFEKICAPIFDEQMKLGEEVVRLTALRDRLIPLLLNGQVTIEN